MKLINLQKPQQNVLNAVKDERFRVVFNEKPQEIELLLYGDIGDEWTGTDAATVVKSLAAAGDKPLTLRINSPGGLAFDGLAMYNAIASYRGPTTAIIESLAASSASLIAIAADTVKAYANATYAIHEGLTFAFGHAADLRDALSWLETFNAAAAETYAEKTGISIADLRAAMLGENGDGTQYTAEQAKSAGFIDEVLPIGNGKKKPAQASAAAAFDFQGMLNYRQAKAALTDRRK